VFVRFFGVAWSVPGGTKPPLPFAPCDDAQVAGARDTEQNAIINYSETQLDWMKRSIVIAGHRTSISIEEPFWKGLREIAAAKEMKLSELVASIDKDRQRNNLSSHIRLFVLEHYQAKAATPTATEQTTSSTAPSSPR